MARYELTSENLKRITCAAQRLLGSAGSVDDALADAFEDEDATLVDFSTELLVELDDQVAECEGCGFWAEAGAVVDGVCEDCADAEDDE